MKSQQERIREFYDKFSDFKLSHDQRKEAVNNLTEDDMRKILLESCECWASVVEDF